MILRRVIEHVKAQNWTAVALDFVIVVVGVFIGIQVSNWNDVRRERNEEKQILARLQAEADELQTALVDYHAYHKGLVADNYAFVARLEREDGCAEVDDELKYLFLTAADFPPPRFTASTIDSLVASGQLTLLRSAAVRDSIAEFADKFSFLSRQWSRFVLPKQELELTLARAGGLSVTGKISLSGDAWGDLSLVRLKTPENLCGDPALIGLVSDVAVSQEIYDLFLDEVANDLETYRSALDAAQGLRGKAVRN